MFTLYRKKKISKKENPGGINADIESGAQKGNK
jgi:hypothetical protein